MRRLFCAIAALAALTSPALAQRAACHKGASFEQWLDAFKREAVAQGVSQRAIAASSHLMTYDQSVVKRDRGQKVFAQTFLEFSDRMVARHRIHGGDCGILGAGNRLRRLHGQSADDQVGDLACL